MPLSLADEFYLIAHSDTTGQTRLHQKSVALGLGSALIAELYLLEKVTITGNGLVVISTTPPQDLLAHKVLDHLLGEKQQHPVRDWLAFVGLTATEDVATRLTRQGLLEMVESRKLFGVTRSYVPVSMNDAAWPRARITSRLSSRQQMELSDQILAGLCYATGLIRDMLWGEAAHGGRLFLAQIIADLPSPLRMLINETEIAVSKTAATRG